MIRRSPCEVYIKYLLVHPDTFSNDDVIDLLRLKQLDFLSPAYLDRLRLGLKVPKNFRPHDLLHPASSRFLAKHCIHYLFHPNKSVQQSMDILDDPRAKEDMEAMLITADPAALIAHRMRSLGRKCDVDTVERYKFFFFNVDLVDSTELRAILRLRVDFSHPESDEYEDQMRAAMKKSAYRDPRRMMADQPTRAMGTLLNQMRMGYMPSQLELSRLLTATRAVTAAQAFSSAQIGGHTGASEARDYVLASKMIGEMMNDIGSPDSDLQAELQAIALRTDKEDVPYIGELTSGEHTVDVMPITGRSEETADVDR
jgi:hypothetical protein